MVTRDELKQAVLDYLFARDRAPQADKRLGSILWDVVNQLRVFAGRSEDEVHPLLALLLEYSRAELMEVLSARSRELWLAALRSLPPPYFHVLPPIYQGYLLKKNKVLGWRRHFFTLKYNALVYVHKKDERMEEEGEEDELGEDSTAHSHRGSFDVGSIARCAPASSKGATSKEHSFAIEMEEGVVRRHRRPSLSGAVSWRKQWVFAAASDEERDVWVAMINDRMETMIELRGAIESAHNSRAHLIGADAKAFPSVIELEGEERGRIRCTPHKRVTEALDGSSEDGDESAEEEDTLQHRGGTLVELCEEITAYPDLKKRLSARLSKGVTTAPRSLIDSSSGKDEAASLPPPLSPAVKWKEDAGDAAQPSVVCELARALKLSRVSSFISMSQSPARAKARRGGEDLMVIEGGSASGGKGEEKRKGLSVSVLGAAERNAFEAEELDNEGELDSSLVDAIEKLEVGSEEAAVRGAHPARSTSTNEGSSASFFGGVSAGAGGGGAAGAGAAAAAGAWVAGGMKREELGRPPSLAKKRTFKDLSSLCLEGTSERTGGEGVEVLRSEGSSSSSSNTDENLSSLEEGGSMQGKAKQRKGSNDVEDLRNEIDDICDEGGRNGGGKRQRHRIPVTGVLVFARQCPVCNREFAIGMKYKVVDGHIDECIRTAAKRAAEE
uniref:PH domain-containing protein n=1 Tax=Palpitomonas bilix TaxID=652834 RepID=A0A7S3D9P6_9EUKA|mmetsp:Transcript_280/g.401  ORF Transcript_280/g.401 Transcript_280/m.401 type:complete len:669 (+) Transcript_280:94-2100(+)